MKKFLIFTILLYILSLLQTSFLVHFHIFGIIPNFILIAAIFINLFEKPEDYSGICSSAFGGFFLDVFSENFLGFWTLILVFISFFIKFILKKNFYFIGKLHK